MLLVLLAEHVAGTAPQTPAVTHFVCLLQQPQRDCNWNDESRHDTRQHHKQFTFARGYNLGGLWHTQHYTLRQASKQKRAKPSQERNG